LPIVVALGGAAFGAQPAWCAQCNRERGHEAMPSRTVSGSAPVASAVAGSTELPLDVGGHRPRAAR
jgi:hypothetical protein